MNLSICICGWYFHEPFLKRLHAFSYPVHIVAHREGNCCAWPNTLIPNEGLEFGAYDYYIKNIWDSSSNVLFMHDDSEIEDGALEKVQALDDCVDQAFIYTDGKEELQNDGGHGRVLYASKKFLDTLLLNDGFWYDKGNTGQIDPESKSGAKHNMAIYNFIALCRNIKHLTGWPVGMIIHIPEIKNGRRGCLR